MNKTAPFSQFNTLALSALDMRRSRCADPYLALIFLDFRHPRAARRNADRLPARRRRREPTSGVNMVGAARLRDARVYGGWDPPAGASARPPPLEGPHQTYFREGSLIRLALRRRRHPERAAGEEHFDRWCCTYYITSVPTRHTHRLRTGYAQAPKPSSVR